MTDYASTVRDSIENFGFHLTYVGSDDSPPFCYSTGIFEKHSIPEIFISSLPPNLCHELIAGYINRFRENEPPINQRISAIEERFDYFLIPVNLDRLAEYVLASIEYYENSPFEYVQLIYPDVALRFPGEPNYDYDQEILGAFPPPSVA